MSLLTPHISILNSSTQAISVADTAQVITFDTTLFAKKIIATSSSRFTANEAGDYLVVINGQCTSSAANKVLSIWIRRSGTDVALTRRDTTVINNEVQVFAISSVITLTAGQYIELWMSGNSTALSLIALGAGTTPTRPTSPSIDVTIDRLP